MKSKSSGIASLQLGELSLETHVTRTFPYSRVANLAVALNKRQNEPAVQPVEFSGFDPSKLFLPVPFLLLMKEFAAFILVQAIELKSGG